MRIRFLSVSWAALTKSGGDTIETWRIRSKIAFEQNIAANFKDMTPKGVGGPGKDIAI